MDTQPTQNNDAQGELYIIQTCERTRSCLKVYKVGRTCNHSLSQGLHIIMRLPVSNTHEAKSMLLSLCRLKFIQRKDLGNDYFEGVACDFAVAMLNVVGFFPLNPVMHSSGKGDSKIEELISTETCLNSDSDNDTEIHDQGLMYIQAMQTLRML